jgi:hypothetical protein
LLWYLIGRSVTVGEVPVPALSRQWLKVFNYIRILLLSWRIVNWKKPAVLEHGEKELSEYKQLRG